MTGKESNNATIMEMNKVREKYDNAIEKREHEIINLPKKKDPDGLKIGQIVRKRKPHLKKKIKLESQWLDPFWIIISAGKGCCCYWIQR